jgi:ribosomal protein S18 acetylase RimI-like enzyme
MSALQVSFDPVQESDFEMLADLRVAAMRPSLERVGRFDVDRARGRLRATFSPEHSRHIVVGGRRVGLIVVKPHDDGLMLENLYLLPGTEGAGIGTAVLTDLFKQTDAAGQDVYVDVLLDSDANRFYLQHGFEEIGREAFDVHYVRRAKR